MEAGRAFREVSGPGSGGREMGPPASMYVDIDGESIWAVIRCDETSPVPVAAGGRFGIDCLGPDNKIKNVDTIFKFDPNGNVVKSFGAGMFIWPHGLLVDRDGNVWVTDGVSAAGCRTWPPRRGVKAGHQVFKFSPDGKVLHDARRSGRSRQRSSTTSSRRARLPWPPTATSSSRTATKSTATTA